MDNPFDLGAITQMLGDVQRKMEMAKADATRIECSSQAGGGAVFVTANGAGQLTAVRIQPDSLRDIELLEDLIRAAANEALRAASAQAAQRLEQVTAGLVPPGLLGT